MTELGQANVEEFFVSIVEKYGERPLNTEEEDA